MLTQSRMSRILADMKPLGELLKDWREASKLTPSEAARRCKMSAQHYGLLERGDRPTPRPTTLHKLSDATGIPYERLAASAYAEPVPA